MPILTLLPMLCIYGNLELAQSSSESRLSKTPEVTILTSGYLFSRIFLLPLRKAPDANRVSEISKQVLVTDFCQ